MYANRTACQVFGYSQEELRKKNLVEIDPNYTGPEWRRYWEESRPDDALVYETLYINRNGRPIPVEVRGQPAGVQRPELHLRHRTRYFGTKTHRRSAPAQRIKIPHAGGRHPGLRNLYPRCGTATLPVGTRGRSACTGILKKKFSTKTFCNFLYREMWSGTCRVLRWTAPRGTGCLKPRAGGLRKDGTQFWGHTVTTSLHDPEGQLYGFVRVMRDMTEKKTGGRRTPQRPPFHAG